MPQDFHNPFDAPTDVSHAPVDQGPGLLGQVTLFGWCSLAQGVLEGFVGGVFIAFAGLAWYESRNMPDHLPRDFGPNESAIVMGVYGIGGSIAILAGLFRMFSAFKLMRYESRMMGFASLGVGTLTSVTVCCSITSIGLLVWGILVLINDPVRRAFELRTAGHSKPRIDSMLGLSAGFPNFDGDQRSQ